MKSKRLILIILSFSSLLIGAIIYLFFRIETLIIFQWIELLQFTDSLEALRDRTESLNDVIPVWFVYSLPNGLWLFSFITAISVIWYKERIMLNIYILSVVAFALIIEIGQGFGVIIGTFDIYDVIFIILFGGLGIITANILPND